jgi:GNAT superfamily N-acetyltransferase
MVLQAVTQTRSGLVFALERKATFWAEAQALFPLHWEEVAKDKHIMQLDVDEHYYSECERTGKILYVTARFEGRLVGYVWWLMYFHPHYKTVKCAQGDIHYLAPEHRTGLNGYLLLKHAVKVARAAGAVYCFLREKVGQEHPAMLRRLGFKPLDLTWSCDLTEPV